MSEIKDEALKQLFWFKMEQLRNVRDSYEFNHPIGSEVVWGFSSSFDKFYEDEKMLSILDTCYREFETEESRAKLMEKMTLWMKRKGYERSQVF